MLLLLRAVLHDVGGAQVTVGAQGQEMAAVHPRMAHGLACDAAGYEIGAGASILLRDRQAQKAHAAQLPPDFKTEFAFLVRFLAQGSHLFLAEAVNGVAKHPLFVIEREIHELHPPF